MIRLSLKLLIVSFLLAFCAQGQTYYFIRLQDSTYSAQLRGKTGRTTQGEVITGTWNSNKKAHRFSLEKTGPYDLYVDPDGGGSYVLDSHWSGNSGKLIPGSDVEDWFEKLDANYRTLSIGLGDTSVATAKIKDLNVTTAKIAASAVDSGKIAPSAVRSSDIGDGEVKDSDIALGAVTTTKLADSSVTESKIPANQISLSKMTQAARDYIGSAGNITNNPDDVTLETNQSNELQIKNDGIKPDHIGSGTYSIGNEYRDDGIYIMSNFYNGYYLWIGISGNGKKWEYPSVSTQFDGHPNELRDPSIMEYNGYYYVAFTVEYEKSGYFRIIRSKDLITWTNWDTVTAFNYATECWAPEWFKDTNGDIYLYYTADLDSSSATMQHQPFFVKATNTSLTSWTSPNRIDGGALPSNLIDLFVIKQGDYYWMFYKNEGTYYTNVARSLRPDSAFFQYKTTNWTGWAYGAEGTSIVKVDSTTWRAYYDSGSPSLLYWSECSDDQFETWTTPVLCDSYYGGENPTVIKTTNLSAFRDAFRLFIHKSDTTQYFRVIGSKDYPLQSNVTSNADWNHPGAFFAPSVGVGKNVIVEIGKVTSAYNSGYLGFHYSGASSTSNYMTIGLTNKDHIITALATGKVGIGDTNPQTTLSVYDGTTASLGVKTATAGLHFNTSTANCDMQIGRSSNLGYANVLLANSPTFLSSLQWALGLRGDATNNLHFYDDANDITRMMIKQSNGYVAIGNTSPTAKLHVSGNIKADHMIDSLNVKMFGAIGDSATNDYSAIWAAIQKAKKWGGNGGRVYLPAGTYRIASTISLVGSSYNNIIFEGDGVSKTLLVYSPATGNAVEIGDGTVGNLTQYIHFKNMTIKGTKSSSAIDSTNNGILISYGANCKLTNVTIRNFRGSGFKNLEDSWTNNFNNCDFSYNNQYGVYGGKAVNLWQFNNCNFIGNKIGTYFRTIYSCTFQQSDWTTSDSSGCIITTGTGLNMFGNWFEQNNVGGYGNTTHLTLGDSATSKRVYSATLAGNYFSTIATMDFAIKLTTPYDLFITGNVAGGVLAPIKLTKFSTYAASQMNGTIKNVLGDGDTRPLMYIRNIGFIGKEYVETGAGVSFRSSDSLRWVYWSGDEAYQTASLMGYHQVVRNITSSTETTNWNADLGLMLTNKSNTNNNFMSIANTNYGTTISSGILFKTTNQASAYGDIYFATRSSGGFKSNNLVLTNNKAGIGVSPTTSLDVYDASTANFRVGTSTAGLYVNASTSNADFQVGRANSTSYANILLANSLAFLTSVQWAVGLRNGDNSLHFYDDANDKDRMVLSQTGSLKLGTGATIDSIKVDAGVLKIYVGGTPYIASP